MKIVQVELSRHIDSRTRRIMTTWVPYQAGLKVGLLVELEEYPDEIWTIGAVYWTSQADLQNLNRKWGLELPKSQRTEI